MAATKLSLYNNALYILGERRLANEFEDNEPRYVLDEITNLEAYGVCLELVKPRFAVRSAKLASPTTSSVHGLDQVYSFPADYISTLGEEGVHGANASFFSDEDLEDPVDRYIIEGRTVATDVATNLYLRYVSNASSLSEWTPMFGKLVAAYLAKEAASRINPNRIEYAETAFQNALAVCIQYESVKENPIIPQKQAAALSATELEIYNMVAHELGRAEFRSTGDESGLRVAIDSVYDLVRDSALSIVKPRFATLTAQLTGGAASGVHGFDNVFPKPVGMVDIVSLWGDEDLSQPVERWFLEDNDIVVDSYTTAYLRYISNAATTEEFSPNFKQALACMLAQRLSPRFSPDTQRVVEERADKAVQVAIQIEGFKEPVRRPIPTTRVLDAEYLDIYNKALQIMKLPRLIDVNDESERRVALDYALDQGAVETVFELISWGFAYERAELDEDGIYSVGGVLPDFGFNYRFDVPADMVRIDKISANEDFNHPIEYIREGAYFYAYVNKLYVNFVSNDQVTTPNSWPRYLRNLVAAELARSCLDLPGVDLVHVENKYQEYKDEAYNTDAQRNPPQVISSGSWVTSRYDARDRRRNETP